MHNWGTPGRVDAAADAAIREVVTVYCHLMDNFEDDAVLELFEPDGEWWPHGEQPLRGRAAIAAWLRGRDRGVKGRHVASNILVELEDLSRAKVTSYFTVFKAAPDGAPTPVSMGEYHDLFRFEDGRWRFARRETRRVFRAG